MNNNQIDVKLLSDSTHASLEKIKLAMIDAAKERLERIIEMPLASVIKEGHVNIHESDLLLAGKLAKNKINSIHFDTSNNEWFAISSYQLTRRMLTKNQVVDILESK